MSERNDLTRWNRAGLTRFRYVDGGAVEFLEILRRQLAENFKDREIDLRAWLSPPEEIPANEEKPESETLIQRQERLSRTQERILESYRQDRRDWAWEITRTFARACHVLTEHANAYANEGYLGTATQWDHVRRLVEMLDYHPAPPASAWTRLALVAKEGKTGVVAKGFQVKYSPPNGGAKVVFETLEDLFVDPALNALRPKGWDQLDAPVWSPDNNGNGGAEPPADERRFSKIAKGPAIDIAGVGPLSAGKLNGLLDDGVFRIKDFPDLDPDDSGLDIAPFWLREWKTKADILIDFAPPGDWSAIDQMELPEIAKMSAQELAEKSGNSREMAEALKQATEIVEFCLDQGVFEKATLGDLLVESAEAPAEPGSVKSPWRARRKPKVEPGQVAMIFRENESIAEAEAATVDRVDEPGGDIHLLLDQVQYSWPTWPRGEISLHVAPRWKRECWLNGRNVVRTKDPHGLSAGTFVGWVPNKKSTDDWNYPAIQYAEISEVDQRNIRLEYDGRVPQENTELIELRPIDGSVFPADYEAIVLLRDTAPLEVRRVSPNEEVPRAADDPKPRPEDIFSLKEVLTEPSTGNGGGGLLPPASLPKIGSFLFPSPMLPVDLVKAAVELMLSIGVMAIPSTEEIVIKGMPFGGLLEGNIDVTAAAGALYEMLDKLEGTVQKLDASGAPLWKLKAGGSSTYNEGDSKDPYELDDYDNLIPEPTANPQKLVDWRKDESGQVPSKEDIIDALESMLTVQEGEETALFQKILNDIVEKGPLLAVPRNPTVKAVVEAKSPLYVFDGSADKIDTGDWVVGEFSDGLRALNVSAAEPFEDGGETERFSLSFGNLLGAVGELKKVYAEFRDALTPEEAALNEAPVGPANIELEDVPDSLEVGRDLLLTAEGKEPVAAKIESIDGNNITIDPPADDFVVGDLIILGNVVLAGHGERKPAKILGSGDAAKSNQEFTLDVEGVSFTADSTKSSGVAAAVEVEVAGRVWEQVSTLKDSAPDDRHYAVRMTEEGYVKLLFGDGEHGRRLPSGSNNVRVRYRIGSGLAGNVPAGSLEKPVNPHPLIASVHQPLPAAGGGNMEDVASLRENAPPTVLALERAVSLSDFSHLAASQSSVWQAKAFSQVLHGGRRESVKVVIVPAGGVRSGDVNEAIGSFLQKHAPTGVQVTVENFRKPEEPLSIAATVSVKTDEFVAGEVEKSVVSALADHFSLKNRKLGEDLYLSEVYKVVEGVQGVENSICVLNGNASLKVIEAGDERTVICLDPDAGSTLSVTAEEVLP